MYDDQLYNFQPTQNSRNKIIIISIIAAAVIAFIGLIVFLVNKSQFQPALEVKEVTPTLEIYARLSDGIPLGDIETIAKNIDSSAEVTMTNGVGTIKIPETNEGINFYYLDDTYVAEYTAVDETPATDTESLLSEDEVEVTGLDLDDVSNLEDPTASYQPNMAYDFIYFYEMGEDGLFISGNTKDLFQYYDGIDIFEFPTKQEAIDAYLAPLAK